MNDGEESSAAKQSAAANGLSATIVTDPKRQIAAAFGVNTWPTIVSIDRSGVITSIRYGHGAEDPVDYPVQQVPSND